MRDPLAWDRWWLSIAPREVARATARDIKSVVQRAIDGNARALGSLPAINDILTGENFIAGRRKAALARLRAAGIAAPVHEPDGAPNPLAAELARLGGWFAVRTAYGETVADFLMACCNVWDRDPSQRADAEAKFWAALRQVGAA